MCLARLRAPPPRRSLLARRSTYQAGFLSVLYSIGAKPLQIWDKKVRNGHIKRITDSDIQSSTLEICGSNVSTTFITCPADPKKTLGIKLPFLVMIIKNLKKYFTFEVTVLDDKNVHRRFRASNYQSTTRVKPFICTMPMRLDEGWNQIQFNLSDFTRRAYGTNYVETLRVQIHANCRVRRIYFSDRLYTEDELPTECAFRAAPRTAPHGTTQQATSKGAPIRRADPPPTARAPWSSLCPPPSLRSRSQALYPGEEERRNSGRGRSSGGACGHGTPGRGGSRRARSSARRVARRVDETRPKTLNSYHT